MVYLSLIHHGPLHEESQWTVTICGLDPLAARVPLVQKSLHLPLGPISGGFPSIWGLSITASVNLYRTLKITLVSYVD